MLHVAIHGCCFWVGYRGGGDGRCMASHVAACDLVGISGRLKQVGLNSLLTDKKKGIWVQTDPGPVTVGFFFWGSFWEIICFVVKAYRYFHSLLIMLTVFRLGPHCQLLSTKARKHESTTHRFHFLSSKHSKLIKVLIKKRIQLFAHYLKQKLPFCQSVFACFGLCLLISWKIIVLISFLFSVILFYSW